MKAFQIMRYGDAGGSALTDADMPSIADDEVLIRVHAAAVNPLDWMVQAGLLQSHLPHTLPLTPGWDLAGVVVAAGSAVGRNLVGDAVFAMTELARGGAFAEYAAVREEHVARAPYTLSLAEAATCPLVALTAWAGLFTEGGLREGESVLIHAGAGGVGSIAVQLAKFVGARVTATCSGSVTNLVRSLGADVVIDYEKEDFSTLSDVDVVFDTVGGTVRDRSWKVLRPGGTMVTIVLPYDPDARPRGDISSTMAAASPSGPLLAHLSGLIDAGHIKPVVADRFGLSEIDKALALSRGGHTHGKLVIEVAGETRSAA